MKYLKWAALPVLLAAVLFTVALSTQSAEKNQLNHELEDLAYGIASEDADVRLGAVVALASRGEPAIPVLKAAVNDKDERVRQTAIKALARIGGKEAASALAESLSNPDRYIRAKTILILPSVGRPAYPYLIRALKTDPFPRSRMFAAHGITKLARPGDAPDILANFERQDKATKMHLVIALVKIGDRDAYAGLANLIQSPDRLVRFYVANTIAEAPEERALPILMDAMDDEAPEVRMWAIFGLEKLNLPESYPVVLAALNDETFYIRKEAAYTLGTLGNQEAIPHLTPFLRDPHYLVRGSAAEALGRLGDTGAIPEIMPLLAEKNEAVQIQASEALARLNDYSGIETLITNLNAPDQIYREEAYNALRRISNQDFGKNRDAWFQWWESARANIAQGTRSDSNN